MIEKVINSNSKYLRLHHKCTSWGLTIEGSSLKCSNNGETHKVKMICWFTNAPPQLLKIYVDPPK